MALIALADHKWKIALLLYYITHSECIASYSQFSNPWFTKKFFPDGSGITIGFKNTIQRAQPQIQFIIIINKPSSVPFKSINYDEKRYTNYFIILRKPTSFIDAWRSAALKSKIVIIFKTTRESSSFLRYRTAVPYAPRRKREPREALVNIWVNS